MMAMVMTVTDKLCIIVIIAGGNMAPIVAASLWKSKRRRP